MTGSETITSQLLFLRESLHVPLGVPWGPPFFFFHPLRLDYSPHGLLAARAPFYRLQRVPAASWMDRSLRKEECRMFQMFCAKNISGTDHLDKSYLVIKIMRNFWSSSRLQQLFLRQSDISEKNPINYLSTI